MGSVKCDFLKLKWDDLNNYWYYWKKFGHQRFWWEMWGFTPAPSTQFSQRFQKLLWDDYERNHHLRMADIFNNAFEV